MPCPFCSKAEPVRIEIKSLNLRICPNCLAAFLPGSQFTALRKDLNDATKGAWLRKLYTCPEIEYFSEVNCLEHGTPLVPGTLPNYSINGLVPSCCDLQHLPPVIMAKILELGIMASGKIGLGGFRASKPRASNAFGKFLGSIIFHFWNKKPKIDDGFSRLQYDSKFKEVLGEWIPEN
jgi:hypothetical protein